jgi:hypothetical protein
VNGLALGQNITIGDGADVYKITQVNLATTDIESIKSPSGAHVPVPIGKALAFSPATFSTFGEVTGKSTSYDASKPVTSLTLADRYVTVTQNGTIIRLPASPVDGQTHSIKCKAGVTTTVDTVDGVSIDGALTVTVESLENRTFRYSAETSEWEIR